jgi:transposase
MVTAPSLVPRIPGRRVKTDRLDSQKLSMNLKGGQLKGIIVPTSAYRELRHLVHLRDTFAKQLTATKLRIKSLLLLNSIPFPNQDKENWTKYVINQLKEVPCSAPLRFNLNHLLASLEFFAKNILETTRAIRTYCKSDPAIAANIEYITSIPGIGFITASQLIARIGDPRHLKRYDQIGSFLGLVPREHSSGNQVCRGAITRTGHAYLRNKLIQCAWSTIRKDTEMRNFYDAIYNRNKTDYGAKKAITAVARKLTTRIFAVLTEQRNYEIRTFTKENEALSQGKDSARLRTVSINR